MKIAFVSEHYPSKEHTQYCVYLQQQVLALQKLGHKVEIIRLQIGKNVDSTEVLAGIIVHNIYISNCVLDKVYASYEQRLKGKVNWTLYDIVSIHIVSVPFAESVIRECHKVNVPTVFHFHGLNVWDNYYHKNDFIHKLLHIIETRRKIGYLKNCRAIVGVSKGVCDVVRERLQFPKSYLVYNGVDIGKFPRTPKVYKKGAPFNILCVANYIPIKGQEYLINAIAQIVNEDIIAHLYLIGQGPDETKLRNMVADLNIQDNVTFLGLQPYENVYRYMSQADMFIMPSYYDSFGCVYVESMSTGTVTCGCDVYGPKEIINDGVDGLLVKPRNVQSIVDAIKKVHSDICYRKRIEDNAVKRAAQFSWEKSAIALAAVYTNILNN